MQRLAWLLALHRCPLCRKHIRRQEEARWHGGREFTYGLEAANRSDVLAALAAKKRRVGYFCASCMERVSRLGAPRVEAEGKAKRDATVKQIKAWLQRLPQLPKPVAEYEAARDSISAYYCSSREFLRVIEFDSPEDLYGRLPPNWQDPAREVMLNDGTGPGQFYVSVRVSYSKIDDHRVGEVSQKMRSWSDG